MKNQNADGIRPEDILRLLAEADRKVLGMVYAFTLALVGERREGLPSDRSPAGR